MIARQQAPDMSAVNTAAQQNQQISQRLIGLGDAEYEQAQSAIQRNEPIYSQMQSDQLGQARVSASRANQEWGRYQNNFAPVQDRLANDAMNYDSAENMDRAAGEAAGTVQGQFDAARGQNQRSMAAMRVSPSSGRSVQGGINQANQLAMSKVGAVNQGRGAIRDRAIQLRGQAAGMAGQVGASANRQTALASAQQSQASSTMGQRMGGRAAAYGPMMSMYGVGMGGNSASGAAIANSANAQLATNNANANSTNQAAGMAMMALSDEDSKENRQPVNDGQAMQAMRKIPVEQWDYKDGQGDGGHHIGPMAQDVQQAAGDQVAPGGKQIDLVSMSGMQTAGIKNLDSRLRRIEAGLTKVGDDRSAPRRRARTASMEAITL